MTPRLAKIRNGSIALPPDLAKKWKGAAVYLLIGDDWCTIKKIHETPFPTLRSKREALGKMMRDKDIDSAVRAVRRAQKKKKR
jgi:hypothetical protein